MKFSKHLLVSAALLFSLAAFAQEKPKIFDNEEIIIQYDEPLPPKTVIVIEDNKITVNGESAKDNEDIRIIRKNKRLGLTHNFSTWPSELARTYKGILSINDDAFLGVMSGENDKGALVKEVVEGSSADKAGIKKDDVIYAVGDTEIDDPDALAEAIRDMEPGETVAIKLWRDGKKKELKVKLGERGPRTVIGHPIEPIFSPEYNRLFNLNGKLFSQRPKMGMEIQDTEAGNGVTVLHVEEGSPANKAGMQQGDLITAINGASVESVTDIQQIFGTNSDKYHYSITLKRNNKTLEKAVNIPKPLKKMEL